MSAAFILCDRPAVWTFPRVIREPVWVSSKGTASALPSADDNQLDYKGEVGKGPKGSPGDQLSVHCHHPGPGAGSGSGAGEQT